MHASAASPKHSLKPRVVTHRSRATLTRRQHDVDAIPVHLGLISARSVSFARIEPVQQEYSNLLHTSGQVTARSASTRLRAFASTVRPGFTQASSKHRSALDVSCFTLKVISLPLMSHTMRNPTPSENVTNPWSSRRKRPQTVRQEDEDRSGV
jgi:hypothetical protein